jgi:hypothetical protein
MNYKPLNKNEARSLIDSYASADEIQLNQDLTNDEKDLKKKFNERYWGQFPSTTDKSFKKIHEKDDLELGKVLYFDWLSLDGVITIRDASDDGFWRNLSCRVVPYYTRCRWGHSSESPWNADRFYKSPQRNSLKVLWWFLHLSNQGDKIKTSKVIQNCGSDQISQIVERVGKGYDVELSRAIFRVIGKLKNQTEITDALRKAMKLNTMRRETTTPAFFNDGFDGYAKALFKDFGK